MDDVLAACGISCLRNKLPSTFGGSQRGCEAGKLSVFLVHLILRPSKTGPSVIHLLCLLRKRVGLVSKQGLSVPAGLLSVSL